MPVRDGRAVWQPEQKLKNSCDEVTQITENKRQGRRCVVHGTQHEVDTYVILSDATGRSRYCGTLRY